MWQVHDTTGQLANRVISKTSTCLRFHLRLAPPGCTQGELAGTPRGKLCQAALTSASHGRLRGFCPLFGGNAVPGPLSNGDNSEREQASEGRREGGSTRYPTGTFIALS